jgi:PPP family 3-phenylpropionic acid transporter
MDPGTATPHGRRTLSLFWFLHFAGLGIVFPYLGLYLHENAALTGTQVGLVLALVPLVGSVMQPLWGQIADRSGARTRVLALVTIGAALGYAALGIVDGFGAIALTTTALALFATAVVPLSVSVTLAALDDADPHAFGFVRVWGTLGFLALVVGFPWGLHHAQRAWGILPAPRGPAEPGLAAMFGVAGALVLAAGVVALSLPRGGGGAIRAPRHDWRRLLRHGPVVRLFVFSFVAYGFLQGPMGLFPVYVRAHGGDLAAVGRMWVLMLLLEIPLVLLSGAGLVRIGPRGLLAMGVLAGGVRWVVCGLFEDLRVIYPVQLLHGVTVVGVLLGAPLYLEQAAPERLRSTAQTLLATAGVGWGGTASNAAAGWLLEHAGTNAPYLAGGLGALVLGCAVPWVLPRPVRAGADERHVPPLAPHGHGALDV